MNGRWHEPWLCLEWSRGPSGVYQSGRYTLRPVGGGTYAIDVNGHYQNTIQYLDKAKNWCERHRRHIEEPVA